MALRVSSLEAISRKRRNTAKVLGASDEGLVKGADDSNEAFSRIAAVAPTNSDWFSADEQPHCLGRDSSR